MKVQYRILIAVLAVAGAVILFRLLIGGSTVASLMPAGPVASAERQLIETMVFLMLIVVVPMFVLLFTFAWKYRADNSNAKYEPERSHGAWSELVLWAIPAVLVAALGVLAWQSAHTLDPSRQIASSAPGVQPLTIEVVALPWKWLFIYPQQNIATVNFIELPVGTPVRFELTADGPISSFWIPQLGSQIYAMAAMETQINLMASSTGTFTSEDTEINGAGYSGMKFTAQSVSQSDFDAWIASMRQSQPSSMLDENAYRTLAEPSAYNPPAYYTSVDGNLFNTIMMKYMMPTGTAAPTSSIPATSSPAAAQMPGMQM